MKLFCLLTFIGFLGTAHAEISPSCEREIKENGWALVTPSYADDVEAVKAQLARKLKVKSSRLVYVSSMLSGDGAASFSVVVFKLLDASGKFKGFYSVTAYDSRELVSFTLIAS